MSPAKDGILKRTSSLHPAGVELGLGGLRMRVEAADPSNGGPSHGRAPVVGGPHSNGLAHDGAPVGQQLQLRHGPAAVGRDLLLGPSGGREGPQGGRRRLLQERAHGLGLPEDGIHGENGGFQQALGSDGVEAVANRAMLNGS